MKKIFAFLVTAAIAFAPVAAEAGNKHWKHGNHNNWNHGGNNYNCYNCYYKKGHNNNNNFYNDPNFWAGAGVGLLGGIIGGAIANDNYYDGPAPMAPQCIVQPYKVWDDYQGWVIQYRQLCN